MVVEEPGEEPRLYRQDTGELVTDANGIFHGSAGFDPSRFNSSTNDASNKTENRHRNFHRKYYTPPTDAPMGDSTSFTNQTPSTTPTTNPTDAPSANKTRHSTNIQSGNNVSDADTAPHTVTETKKSEFVDTRPKENIIVPDSPSIDTSSLESENPCKKESYDSRTKSTDKTQVSHIGPKFFFGFF
jgi:hypothetical protein